MGKGFEDGLEWGRVVKAPGGNCTIGSASGRLINVTRLLQVYQDICRVCLHGGLESVCIVESTLESQRLMKTT